MNFEQSVNYLYDLGYELSVKKFGLENTIQLLAALDNPEKKYLKIQVAGTNGKGSTCVFVDSICAHANIKTGLYTSPHLISITERIKVNGAEISEKDFARHAGVVREVSEKLVESGELKAVPTFFEQVTAIALNYFAEQKIELAILETGLGGRFDSVTATNAEIVAITPIDLDHQDILGNSLAEIAAEKAAAIRFSFQKIVVSKQKAEAMAIISERCADFGITPTWTNSVKSEIKGGNTTVKECVKIAENWATHQNSTPLLTRGFLPSIAVYFRTKTNGYENVFLGLGGKHQVENAKVAILLAEALRENFEITGANIVKGLEMARYRGRLQFRGKFLFDGAHNVGGAKALKDFLDEFVTQSITLIFGSMKDKDISEIGKTLFPKADKLILTTPDNPRAAKAEELFEFLPAKFSSENVFTTEKVAEALEIAQKISSDNDLILVTGSLYLIGEAQKILNAENYA